MTRTASPLRILVTRPIVEAGLDALRGENVTVPAEDRPMTREELLRLAPGHDALVTMLTDKVDAELFEAAPSVRMVANYAVGYNNIDVAEATRRGILVTNTPDVLTDATADMAWALLLAAARRLGEGERLVRDRGWDGWGPLQLLGVQVAGKTLGIVGPGRIGRATARRAKGFDMKVLYCGRSRSNKIEEETGARRVELEELLRESDFVSLHCPYTPETHHLLGAPQLAMMKPTAVVVNTARGAVIDEAALVEALRSGRIAAAGLDVFEKEPEIHPGLFDLNNAVLAPHLGSATVETRERMALMCAGNLLSFCRGERPPQLLNPEALDASS